MQYSPSRMLRAVWLAVALALIAALPISLLVTSSTRDVVEPSPTCLYVVAQPNPWCYTFTDTGYFITSPPSTFCDVFACIASFWRGQGYVVECGDGDYSLSGGRSGVCSGSHEGFMRNLYQP